MAQQRRSQGKHVPQRTCIACRQVAGKRQLIRLVRTTEGIEVDPTGKRAGRGAYLHAAQGCWRKALQGNQLGAALRAQITAESRAMLTSYMETLPVDDDV